MKRYRCFIYSKTTKFGCYSFAALSSSPAVLFYGAAGVDFLSMVDTFPKEDEKVRSTMNFIDGGGNAANSSVAASRLGLCAYLLSIVGNDHNASTILQGLEKERVKTKYVIKSKDSPSGCTYVIVCKDSGSRTCIHAPMSVDITRSDIEGSDVIQHLRQFAMVHFDSRHTQASVVLAREARSVGVTVSVDLEKLRPYVLELLPYCNVLFTNKECSALFYPHE